MAYELKKIQYLDVTSNSYEKFEVYDQYRGSFTLSSVVYSFVSAADGTIALSGSGIVNNSDTDFEDNTIKTVQVVIDCNNTEVSTGKYYLVLTVTMSTGEKEIFRVTYQVKDYKAVY